MDYWHRAGRCGLGHDNPIVGLRMIGYELIGGLYDNPYIFARTRPLMTGVIGFNSPVEHDHSVGIIGDGKFVLASEEERWTRQKHSPENHQWPQALSLLEEDVGRFHGPSAAPVMILMFKYKGEMCKVLAVCHVDG
jgi:predicted NodU family carbamoyl transferase